MKQVTEFKLKKVRLILGVIFQRQSVRMTDKELKTTLEKCVKQGNCFTTEVRDILIVYKNSGGLQEKAQEILEQIKIDSQNKEATQDSVDDILDIVTSWCGQNMRVW